MQSRCDTKLDCNDFSDESECKIVALDKDRYKKDNTPSPADPDKEKLEVILNIDVQNILGIKEVQKILALKFDLEACWKDDGLQFHNLKLDEDLNTLVYAEKQSIWVPQILFSNTKDDVT